MKNFLSAHEINNLEKLIFYQFNDKTLLCQALTHSSFANEHGLENNERLEFLGDAVLELCISKALYEQFPTASEGELTKARASMVNEVSLAQVARSLKLGQYILLGKGEEMQGGKDRDSVLSDTLEAIFGAIFLDGGYEQVKTSINKIFSPFWPKKISLKKITKDYKTRLQELTQKIFKQRPVYTLVDSQGPEHAKIYLVQVSLPDGTNLKAKGTSVKKAEQKAAQLGLKFLQERL
ncbi:ribonuclease III [Desulfohalobiaceae bacterium Ax17]|jgi:ribonuclease-3|uniref:ribonuclease III n=1 Tax=Desulfovulcanus ferrireducens TaxID=2831190 RepID=UPI00207BC20C|nr:ribonuclease III [Desulfovulcanus ferrireducens]MBT8764206.1 ribonuclease III [Desulfovulcanus ferrireducens]